MLCLHGITRDACARIYILSDEANVMDAHAVSLLAIFETKMRLEVPLFQRQYVWSREHQYGCSDEGALSHRRVYRVLASRAA